MLPARPSLESFYTPLSWSRLRALRVNDPPYNHVKRTIAAMEHAMITEEARTLALVEIDRQKVENQILSVKMNHPEWDDSKVLKTVYAPRDKDNTLGLAVLKVSDVSTSQNVEQLFKWALVANMSTVLVPYEVCPPPNHPRCGGQSQGLRHRY